MPASVGLLMTVLKVSQSTLSWIAIAMDFASGSRVS
jgi:hypothetical protein